MVIRNKTAGKDVFLSKQMTNYSMAELKILASRNMFKRENATQSAAIVVPKVGIWPFSAKSCLHCDLYNANLTWNVSLSIQLKTTCCLLFVQNSYNLNIGVTD